MEKQGLHHLNQSDKCTGVYTYGEEGGKRSAIDHILVNDKFMEHFKSMYIDENKEDLNISDYNLVKSWFNIREEKTTWKKPRYENIEWYKRDQDLLKNIE